MSGFLTTEFQTLADISHLDLSNNRFSGDFNTMFAGLTNLGKILECCVSSVLPDMSSFSFLVTFTESLLLVNNPITGSLPPEIQSFSNLGTLQPEIRNACSLMSWSNHIAYLLNTQSSWTLEVQICLAQCPQSWARSLTCVSFDL